MSYANPDRQREYGRQWVAARREAWLKTNGPCKRCGSCERLQVDHVDPSKKVSHRIWSWSALRREAELAKCQVLCEACHIGKTYGPLRHGTVNAYDRHRCRCQRCRDAKAMKMAAVRRNRRVRTGGGR